jgi:hypothetical protein
MKHIITLIAVAFTLSLGACCTTGGTCPVGGKKDCSKTECSTDKKKCCGSQACKDKAAAHKH